MSIIAEADSGDNPTFISYRANVAEAWRICGDFVKTQLPA